MAKIINYSVNVIFLSIDNENNHIKRISEWKVVPVPKNLNGIDLNRYINGYIYNSYKFENPDKFFSFNINDFHRY